MSGSDFTGDIAVVTGAARGLGQAVARLLASRGAMVVIGDIDQAAAEICATALREDGFEAHAVAVDVTDEESVAAFADRVRGHAGRAGILINNAGYHAAQPEDIAEVIAFLASRENRFMTGETVIANGGYHMV